ncbi:MAG TPA: 1-acyl-sn-glycerol-3-phosphate acyltransferase [Polyangiaceae bacterium]|nr:1-acyl-sn-glycerol-3-phosphate acyltransferase [Polyangiaceae bacterium]
MTLERIFARGLEVSERSAPIFRFNEARGAIVDDVVARVVGGVKDPLYALSDAAYLEMRRLGPRGGHELAEWRSLAGKLGRMSEGELRAAVTKYTKMYAWDVAGNFDPRVYQFASRAMAPLLGALMSPRAMVRNIPQSLDLTALDSRIVVQGPREHVRKLTELGTVVYTPTHLSNLDSVVFGFALERAGLPPATYGAGKNLFTNPVLSYFMHNLGAYRVDRRLRHALYKDVLKAYSCVLLERGYHSLFFPGGTRSRSGGVERKLKLGLAGTGIEAFARTVEAGRPRKVFFVPATINYLLTLEAETLIDDFLQEEGKARFIIDDDESTRVGRVAAFVQKLFGLDGACVVRFGQPLDCFGNLVDDEGRSHDARGREVAAETFLERRDGTRGRDTKRDAEYTRELGVAICRAFKRDTVVMSTHLVATAAFGALRRHVGDKKGDLFAILGHKDDFRVPRAELVKEVDRLLAEVHELERRGDIVVAPGLRNRDAPGVLEDALRALAGYHVEDVLSPRGDDLALSHTRLLFYYQNRLALHGLGFDALK